MYSGNGNDRGDTAQYDKSATPTPANVSFWKESKIILDPAPSISTSCVINAEQVYERAKSQKSSLKRILLPIRQQIHCKVPLH